MASLGLKGLMDSLVLMKKLDWLKPARNFIQQRFVRYFVSSILVAAGAHKRKECSTSIPCSNIQAVMNSFYQQHT